MPLIHCRLGPMTHLESGALAGFLRFAATRPDWTVAVEAWNEIPPRGPRPDACLVRGATAARRIHGLPVVSISGNAPGPSVWVDDGAIGIQAAQHLLGRGFRELAYRGDPRIFASCRRRDGFFAAARQAGAAFRDLPPGPALARAWSIAAERTDTQRALSACPRPLGLLAFTAHVGRRVLAALPPGEVPHAVAVVAGDSDPLVAQATRPHLACVETAPERLGVAAAEMLDDLLARPRARLGQRLIAPTGVDAGASAAGQAVADAAVLAALDGIARGLDDVPALAATAGVSRRTLELRFAAALGEAPAAAIRRARLARALDLLRHDGAPIAEIAQRCGWASATRFSADISRATGMPPAAWRLGLRRGQGPDPMP